MIASAIFLGSIVAMVMLVAWVIKNDGAGLRGKTTGLLAMKEPEEPEAPTEKKPPPYIG